MLYGGGGIGATMYRTYVNALNDGNGGGNYATLFNTVFANTGSGQLYKNRKDVIDALKDGMDDTYETPAQNALDPLQTRPKVGKNTLKPSGTVLVGIAFKLGKRINLAIEDRFTFIKDDLLDGQRWQEHARVMPY